MKLGKLQLERLCGLGSPSCLLVVCDDRVKNLACWCKPGSPCHADVLLGIANG